MSRPSRFNVIFLFPSVYRPFKTNFAKRFELLSERCSGHIFTLCSDRHRGLALGNFRLHSERVKPGGLGGVLSRVWIQTVIPAWRLWGGSKVHAVIAYDPYASGLAGMVLKRLFGAKLIIEVNGEYHGEYHRAYPPGQLLKKRGLRLLYGTSTRCSDALKVVNRALEAFLLRRYPGKSVYRFPDFSATEYFQSLECYQGDYLLSVGEPFHRKGMDVLIRAFRSISDRHPGVRLRIMGYCPEAELLSYRQAAAHDPRIEFVRPGWIEDVGEQMRGCYALVNAARSDAAPRVHFEAMACRKPVVATRTNGGIDYVRDGETGLLCDIDNAEDLAAKLDYLLTNPTLATRMGEAGRERLQKEFSEEQYANSFFEMLEEVVPSAR